MDLHNEGLDYAVVIDPGETRPVVESCRETMHLIAVNDHRGPEKHYTRSDWEALELMARIAVHANTRTNRNKPLILKPDELVAFEQSMKNFASIEFTKRAIEDEIRRSGVVLANPRIEARSVLAQETRIILRGFKEARARLDNDAATEAERASIEDSGLAGG